MIETERKSTIVSIVNARGFVSLKELCDQLQCSESTVRRDLFELDRLGKISKERGGAASLSSNDFMMADQKLITRERMSSEVKTLIAKKAVSLIKDNMTIYIDAGSTTLALARQIRNMRLTVVTDSFTIAKILAEKGITVYLVGGQLKLTTDAAIGPIATELISRFTFNLGFFGANAVNPKDGFMTPDIQEGFVKEMAVSRCAERFFLVDASKFNCHSVISFAGISGNKAITDYIDSDRQYAPLEIISPEPKAEERK